MIQKKRAYETAEPTDGYRILIDRLWPRGIKKAELPLGEWAKELAPSSELRKSFGHEPAKWREFRARYREELRAPQARQKLAEIATAARKGRVTLVYAARDEEHNNASVVQDVIEKRLKRRRKGTGH